MIKLGFTAINISLGFKRKIQQFYILSRQLLILLLPSTLKLANSFLHLLLDAVFVAKYYQKQYGNVF